MESLTRLQQSRACPSSTSTFISSSSPRSHSASPPASFNSMFYRPHSKDARDAIDFSVLQSSLYNLSPASSDSDFSLPSSTSSAWSLSEAFFATRSCVVRLYNLPQTPDAFVSALFLPQPHLRCPVPVPVAVWTLKSEYCKARPNSVWLLYKSHEEASLVLSFLSPTLSITPALESELEPHTKLRHIVLDTPTPTTRSFALRTSASQPVFRTPKPDIESVSVMGYGDYTISSNPPNAKTTFRLGDWMCSSPKCAAHNFGRNLACIGCGCPRSGNVASSLQNQQAFTPPRASSSPRFSTEAGSIPSLLSQQQPQNQSSSTCFSPQSAPRKQNMYTSPTPSLKHPLLTPSGRAFAVGGRVQNISSDPLSPCIMYWPDNEPFPEQGQIRPGNLSGVPQPPILNTGNKGPISHQPGDWICKKCNYLNWRRRKVCQTCLPYAEGNGDSISAAVQAERITLLTSVLTQAQNQANQSDRLRVPSAARSYSPLPLQQPCPSASARLHQSRSPFQSSSSQPDLGVSYTNNHPIYQTSGQRQPSPLYSTGPECHSLPVHAPAPLLPSFLQDIVQSPTLSPSSTSSADLSLDEYDDVVLSKMVVPRTHASDDSVADSPFGNIWRLDGEECKSLSAFALPNRQELLGAGAGGKFDRDVLRPRFSPT